MFTIGGRSISRLFLLLPFTLAAGAAQTPQTPVILISVDTLRADHLSVYGYRKLQTPHIDSLAIGGTLFAQIQTQIPLTLPSHTSLFTSTYPFQSRVEENAERVPSGVVTLASVLRAQGYKTAAFIGSSLLDRRFGFDIGFDFYDSPFDTGPETFQNPYSVRVRRDGALVIRSAMQWLNAHRGEKVFVFIHLYDLHTPYTQPRTTGAHRPLRLSNSRPATNELSGYDTEIAYVDQLLGRFQQYLSANDFWNRSLVVLFADHGESLGDHGEQYHGYFVYQSTLWVPLLFHWPQDSNEPNTIDHPGGLIDVAPTILDFLRIPAPPSFEGESLLKPVARFVYSESLYARDTFGWASLRALREGQMEYIDAPRPELYNLQTDPHELSNLILKDPGQAQSMKRHLDALRTRYAANRTAPAHDTSPETVKRMRSLGYISGERREERNAPDPKDRLPEYRQFERGLEALYAGHLSIAIATFQSLLAADPHNLPARGNLGDAFLKAHRDTDALRQWQIALHDDPTFAPAESAIAEYWIARGEFAKAKPSLEHIVKTAPGDYQAQYELGLVDRHMGLDREAATHLAAACNLLPESPACAVQPTR